jgi:hypothetical protein
LQRARSRAARRTSESDYEGLISDDSEDEVVHEQADVPASTSTDDHAPDVSSPPGTEDEDNNEPEESIRFKNKTTRQWCRQALDLSRCHAARKLMQVRRRLRAARAPSEASADDIQDTQLFETEPVEDASLESPALASPDLSFTSPTRPPQADPAILQRAPGTTTTSGNQQGQETDLQTTTRA